MTGRRRPWRLPLGVTTGQARAAGLAICAAAQDRDDAEHLLRAAGLIRDPDIKDAHLANPAIGPMGHRKLMQAVTR